MLGGVDSLERKPRSSSPYPEPGGAPNGCVTFVPRASAAGHYVVTGTSGTGKTRLIEHLQKLGYRCHAEPVRKVLREQLAVNGPALPANDPALFLRHIAQQCVHDLADATARAGPSFFDRGLPDAVAYAVRFGVDPREFQAAAAAHRYANEVFVLPPWREIFVNDELRGASFDDYQRFHDQITRAYLDCGYTLIEVPRGTVESRADFIVATLATCVAFAAGRPGRWTLGR